MSNPLPLFPVVGALSLSLEEKEILEAVPEEIVNIIKRLYVTGFTTHPQRLSDTIHTLIGIAIPEKVLAHILSYNVPHWISLRRSYLQRIEASLLEDASTPLKERYRNSILKLHTLIDVKMDSVIAGEMAAIRPSDLKTLASTLETLIRVEKEIDPQDPRSLNSESTSSDSSKHVEEIKLIFTRAIKSKLQDDDSGVLSEFISQSKGMEKELTDSSEEILDVLHSEDKEES